LTSPVGRIGSRRPGTPVLKGEVGMVNRRGCLFVRSFQEPHGRRGDGGRTARYIRDLEGRPPVKDDRLYL
ncbi:MAG: hypothetical protein PHP59_12240, partial [Methanofollis sp.]|uniref:hypothetical protein n=1 Tax=Methanofollis sp. TaxID=2052835 RepID=UPI0026205023